MVHTAGLVAVTVVMAFVLLHYTDLLYKFQALSSIGGGLKCLFAPGVFLTLLGSIFTGACRWPVLGGILFILVLASLAAVLVYGFRKQGRLSFLGVLPSVLLFLFVVRLGYRIYALNGAVLFSQALGLLLSALLLIWMRRVDRLDFAVLTVIVGYAMIGFYALLPALVFAVRKPYVLLSVALVPVAYCLPSGGVSLTCWLAGTPAADLDFGGMWPLAASWIVLAAADICPPDRKGMNWAWLAPALVVYALCVWSVFEMPYRWGLFHRQLSAERHLEAGRWHEALEVCAGTKVTNDVLVAYRNAALFEMGRLEEDCVRYSFTIDQSEQPGYEESLRLAGPTIYYYCGLYDMCAESCRVINASIAPSNERNKLLELSLSKVARMQPSDSEEFISVDDLPASAPDMVLRYYATAPDLAPEDEPWRIAAKSISLY